jgi:hypothetical protein
MERDTIAVGERMVVISLSTRLYGRSDGDVLGLALQARSPQQKLCHVLHQEPLFHLGSIGGISRLVIESLSPHSLSPAPASPGSLNPHLACTSRHRNITELENTGVHIRHTLPVCQSSITVLLGHLAQFQRSSTVPHSISTPGLHHSSHIGSARHLVAQNEELVRAGN